MPNTRVLFRSFAGGELSPEMFGRIDDVKYQTGAAKIRNMIVVPQGPVQNRPGTMLVREVKNSAKRTRLIPFTYNTTQTMVIELGDGYARFHTQGATLTPGSPAAYSGATTYAIGDLVSSGGTNYYCIAATTGNAPPNATYWYAMPSGIYEIPTPFAEADLFDIHHVQSADVLTLVHPNYAPRELRRFGATTWKLNTISFGPLLSAPTGVTITKNGSGTGYNYSYVVTAVSSDDINESVQSATATITNSNLLTSGTYHTIQWSAVSGAARYNIYKLQGGLFGFIGSTTTTSIEDDNIAPDMGVTPATYETVFNSTNNYPGAVSYYEQRRVFAGTNVDPQKLWMTKSGTESDMSYGVPLQDSDRIAFRVAAREANTIRHIVPLTQLILLTNSAEWRVTSVNSDALTPTSISVRPQSYIGANNVQPAIINNSLVYCSARGGHVRELGYSWQANGFITGDLSIRSAHLFDNYDIVDMCFSKSPHPIIWFVSNSGKLLGLTYVPEEQIGSWHQHDTDGTFESCACVSEGEEDHLYVIVNRTIGGATKRFVERMQSQQVDALEDCFYVDCGLTYDGTNTTATTVTVSGGTTWGPADVLTVTASSAIFAYPATTDVNDCIVLTDAAGNKYRLKIAATSSSTVATAIVDNTLPAALRNAATATWAWARDSVSGLTHLNGKTVSILADGAVMAARTVVAGAITLDRASTLVHIGLGYQSDLQTLPLAVNIDGYGQGRYKNINKAWLRVFKSSGIFVGPDADNLVEAKQRSTEPYGAPPALKSDEILVMLTPSWAASGQIYVRQSDPLPLTIVGATVEVAIGG